MKIKCEQTVFLRQRNSNLENMLKVTPQNIGDSEASIFIDSKQVYRGTLSENQPVSLWIKEPQESHTVEIKVTSGEESTSEMLKIKPPKHLEIHMVHISHHDPGYTDIMSHVFRSHVRWIDEILDEMDKREDYPEETRLRISIEQFWSMDYYLRTAAPDRKQKLIDRVKKGDIEITALYGNMITEQLGHEEAYRTMYEANKFAETCGIRINSACHMDVPGISYGMCRVLCDAGVEFLVCDMPDYYHWGYEKLVSFWDTRKIYGYYGPGAFYWQAPDGKKLLFWNSDFVSSSGWEESWIENTANNLSECGYPYDVVRASVRSASFDNTPYTPVFVDEAIQWNRKYAYPKIIISTNETFLKALTEDIERKNLPIPVLSGDLPGQDYPVAALSMQQVTSTARKVQYKLPAAEKLITLAGEDMQNQDALLRDTWRDLLISDDHAYGFQFPAGPAMRASYWEKGTYAMRAEATAEDLFDKALSSFADRIKKENDHLRLVVFNPSGKKVSRGIEAPLREFDNCGTIFFPSNHNSEQWKGYILNRRRRVNPEEAVWKNSQFRLIDLETKEEVPYFIDTLAWDDGEYYAPERCGLAAGGKRMGFFELPGGMERILKFSAADIPAFGYKCYELVPDETCSNIDLNEMGGEINNGIYRICTDDRGICSITDLKTGSELVDPECPHRMGDILVRTKREVCAEVMQVKTVKCSENAIYSKIDIDAEIDGAHELKIRFSMYRNIDRIEVSVHMLRSAKPLQTMFIAFPFRGKGFEYQGVLCELEPGKNTLPGAQSDFLTTADYVAVKESNVLWNAKDTGIVALGNLWEGYVSPAHSCVMKSCIHNPLTEAELNRTGWIYSMLTANNFGTNFMCSQSFDGVYKFSFCATNEQSPADHAFWGESERNPVVTQFTDRSRGELPVSASLIDTGELQCLAFKKAENQDGYIMRLWNHYNHPVPLQIAVNGQSVTDIAVCDALERKTGEETPTVISPNSVLTIQFTK